MGFANPIRNLSVVSPVSVLSDTTKTINVLPFTWTQDVNIPINVNAIDIYVGANGLPTALTVTGLTTGMTYGYQGVLTKSGSSYIRVPMNPVSDPVVRIGGTLALGALTTFRVIVVGRTDSGVVAAFGALSQAADAAIPSTLLIPDDAVFARAQINAAGTYTLFAADVGLPLDGAVSYRLYACGCDIFGATTINDYSILTIGGTRVAYQDGRQGLSRTVSFPGGVFLPGKATQLIAGGAAPQWDGWALVRFNV